MLKVRNNEKQLLTNVVAHNNWLGPRNQDYLSVLNIEVTPEDTPTHRQGSQVGVHGLWCGMSDTDFFKIQW